MPSLDLTLARQIVTAHAEAHDLVVVYPYDLATLYRGVLVGALAALRGVQMRPVDLPSMLDAESFAVPGVMPAQASGLGALLKALPVVGPVLADMIAASGEDRVYVAPAALADGMTLLGTYTRLFTYVETWRHGSGAAWSVAWLAVGQLRGGVGGSALGQEMQVRVALGEDPMTARRRANTALDALDLDGSDAILAVNEVDAAWRSLTPHDGEAHVVTMGGPSVALLRAAKAAGVTLALDVPGAP